MTRSSLAAPALEVPLRRDGVYPSPRLVGLGPVVGPNTRLLVLGSFPGVRSLQAAQYYGHPRNHFWPLLGALWGIDLMGCTYVERLQAAQSRGLGLWDAYARCRREGSLDTAIVDAELNDLGQLRSIAPGLQWVAHNGGESARAMKRVAALGYTALRLPSSSPANASWSWERKLAAWQTAFALAGV